MPPLNSQSPAGAPNPQYDFIMNSGAPAPKQKAGFSAPKLPKLVGIIIGILVLLVILIIAISVISSSGKSSAEPYVDAMSRSAEIVRVNTLAKAEIRDSDTLALLSTTSAALTSEQQSIASYLAKTGQVVDPKLLTKYQNPETDKGIQTATQNSNLESVYLDYLKGSLNGYLNSLKSAYATTPNEGKAIVAGAITSTETLLSSSLLD
jgi:hypothetical protein